MHPLDPQRSRWLTAHVVPLEPELRRWLKHYAGLSSWDIDDLIQETYAVLATRESVDDIRNPRTYIYQIAKSLVLQGLRRSKVVRIEAVSDIEKFDVQSETLSPERHAMGRDELKRVADAIRAMPPQTRRAFTLRRVEGLSQREIAAAMGLAESTVEKHIARAIQQLMKQFGRGGKSARTASMSEHAADLQEDPAPNVDERDRRGH
ncbi:RNA polymerase sigma factor [Novosphingobium album (ex Liu et al. 2023)]|uniref:RNA polymerase sigma factor n=1 Tax=Novosphingobium album (ex Liu et al. 2023) TaxID=3031130 RepID=A0ABT5WS89_9SPHN|nr:RNA polymerase sigma factor [Novosphingobium album (ex Liu et al. 2023)]MDE8652899.1 RNA polymerase sigma factor [Novosphingobium album (ex Liu et al. 2023)]